jgi:Mce-associated membrane protein
MKRLQDTTLVTLVLALGILAAALLVVHVSTRSTSSGPPVLPNLRSTGSYTTGSIPSASGRDALAAANREVPDLLSYDYRDISGSLAKALDQTTGSLKTTFQRTFTTSVQPTAVTDKDVATSSVRGASYVGAGKGGAVTCLLFVDQTLTRGAATASTPAHQVDEDRVVVTMTPVGSRWLISALTPV